MLTTQVGRCDAGISAAETLALTVLLSTSAMSRSKSVMVSTLCGRHDVGLPMEAGLGRWVGGECFARQPMARTQLVAILFTDVVVYCGSKCSPSCDTLAHASDCSTGVA